MQKKFQDYKPNEKLTIVLASIAVPLIIAASVAEYFIKKGDKKNPNK